MTERPSRGPNKPARPGRPAPTIEFSERDGTYEGTDPDGRRWRILPAFTGWRLEFRDHGEVTGTYAGTHPTVAAAQAEAAR